MTVSLNNLIFLFHHHMFLMGKTQAVADSNTCNTQLIYFQGWWPRPQTLMVLVLAASPREYEQFVKRIITSSTHTVTSVKGFQKCV